MECVCVYACLESKKAGEVKYMHTGKTNGLEDLKESKEKQVVKIPETPCQVYSLSRAHNL